VVQSSGSAAVGVATGDVVAVAPVAAMPAVVVPAVVTVVGARPVFGMSGDAGAVRGLVPAEVLGWVGG